MERVPFNCGRKLKEIMDQYGWRQEDIADILGVTRQNVSQKINKNDMKVSEVERIIWAISDKLHEEKELYEFFKSPDEIARKYKVSVETLELARKIDGLSEEKKVKLFSLIEQALLFAAPSPNQSAL